MSMTQEVLSLDAGEYAEAGRLLGRAFQDDPLWMRLIHDPERRPELLVTMFTGLIKATVAARGVAEKTPELRGVALWLPPGRDIDAWATVRSGFAMTRFVMALPNRDRKRMMTVLGEVAERRKALVPEAHWYLAAVGVDQEHQHRGHGSALLRHGIRRADRDDAPIYLETETEANATFYQRLGFDVVDEFTPTVLDVPMWLMVRRAA